MSVWKIVLVTAGSALVLSACGGGGGSSSSSSGSSTGCTPKGGSSSGTGTQVVKINPDPNTVGAFAPKTLSIAKGQSVEWDWTDTSVTHSATSDDGTTFDSCLQSAGSKFVVTFNTAGDFTYHCQIHAAMTGDIKVS